MNILPLSKKMYKPMKIQVPELKKNSGSLSTNVSIFDISLIIALEKTDTKNENNKHIENTNIVEASLCYNKNIANKMDSHEVLPKKIQNIINPNNIIEVHEENSSLSQYFINDITIPLTIKTKIQGIHQIDINPTTLFKIYHQLKY